MNLTSSIILPVIYICFGDIPEYLHLNIELAARNNFVIVISNHSPENRLSYANSILKNIKYEDITLFLKGAEIFAPHYRHLVRDGSRGRQLHELRCFQRWFILRDYMRERNITRVFFGDGDSSVFVNILSIDRKRPGCDSVINIERQGSSIHWVGAGESSIWSIRTLSEFCGFIKTMYIQHISILMVKHNNRQSNVVDMSLLWLWWVTHHEAPGWAAGRPWLHFLRKSTLQQLYEIRNTSDDSFIFTKNLNLPKTNPSFKICNGLDVIERTVFDHQHAWVFGNDFNLNIANNGTGIPFVIGPCLRVGGIPETTDETEAAKLNGQRLYLNNVHYQGDSKRILVYDVCRVLTMTGSKSIDNPKVKDICINEFKQRKNAACVDHSNPMEDLTHCI